MGPGLEGVQPCASRFRTASLTTFPSTALPASFAIAAFITMPMSLAVAADEISAAVYQAVAETGAKTVKDIGRVMKAAMAKLAGKAVDGKVVNEAVRKRLAQG